MPSSGTNPPLFQATFAKQRRNSNRASIGVLAPIVRSSMFQAKWGGVQLVTLGGVYLDNVDDLIRCGEFMLLDVATWDIPRGVLNTRNLVLKHDLHGSDPSIHAHLENEKLPIKIGHQGKEDQHEVQKRHAFKLLFDLHEELDGVRAESWLPSLFHLISARNDQPSSGLKTQNLPRQQNKHLPRFLPRQVEKTQSGVWNNPRDPLYALDPKIERTQCRLRRGIRVLMGDHNEDLDGLNPSVTMPEFEAEHFEPKPVMFNMLNTLGQFGGSPAKKASSIANHSWRYATHSRSMKSPMMF
ncbi:hypothetical protein V6N13_048720 [Hibiscus sabdariffa]